MGAPRGAARLELGEREQDVEGEPSKIRNRSSGKRLGGKPLSRGALYRLLANPVYIGQAVHKGKAYPGEHEPIIDPAPFAAVRDGLAGRRVRGASGVRAAEPSPLGGLLVDASGDRMSPSHAVKNHKR